MLQWALIWKTVAYRPFFGVFAGGLWVLRRYSVTVDVRRISGGPCEGALQCYSGQRERRDRFAKYGLSDYRGSPRPTRSYRGA